MNARREAFCRAYARCGVGAQAAREAGYSIRSAHVTAAELLANADVREYVEKLKAERQDAEDQIIKESQEAMKASAGIAVAALVEITKNGEAPASARVQAARAILELAGFGKDNEGPQLIQIVGGLPALPV